MNDPSGELPSSYYLASSNEIIKYSPLLTEESCDVCVIGGGFTGLSAAINLRKKGFTVTLLEARRIGFGASGRNGGQVGVGQRRDQFYLEQKFGLGKARKLWDIVLDASIEVADLIKKYDIKCRSYEYKGYYLHIRINYNYCPQVSINYFERSRFVL